MNIHMQQQTTGMPHLLKDKQCIQQITRPRIGKKNASGRATPSLCEVAVFRHAQDI